MTDATRYPVEVLGGRWLIEQTAAVLPFGATITWTVEDLETGEVVASGTALDPESARHEMSTALLGPGGLARL